MSFGAAVGYSGNPWLRGQGFDFAIPNDLWKYEPEVRTVTSSAMVLNGGRPAYVIVNRTAWLVPPLEQPRSPEVPLGVFTVTLAVPGAEIRLVGIVACNC